MYGFLLIVVGLATFVSAAYCVMCIIACISYVRHRALPLSAPSSFPPISILKPLKGADPEMYQSFRSHCIQNYSEYELLFGISDPQDPAAEIVKRLQQEFPDRRIELVYCDKNLGPNGKVSTLAGLSAIAKYDALLVNDSDIRVERNYLLTIATELQQPGVGLVTCLYRGVPASTMGSKLESLGISADFIPGVLVALLIEGGLRFGLGSTLALRRKDLQAIEGFEALADYLADDYQLGRRIAESNLRVEISRTPVETYLPAYNLSGFITHQLRWMRTIRASRPGGYAGLLMTFTLPWAILALFLARGAHWACLLVAAAILLRFAVAIISGMSVLRDGHLFRLLWLLPLRDLLAPFIWLGGLVGRKIIWRGKEFELRDGKLIPRD